MRARRTSTSAPILMYHGVADGTTPGGERLTIRPCTFEAQLERLAELGFTAVTFAQMAAGLAGRERLPERPVAITFDDGNADFHREALPVLDRLGMPATLFVVTGWLRDAGARAPGRPRDEMLAWGQVAEAAAAGIEVGGHTHSHPELDQLDRDAVRCEVRTCKALLEDRLGRAVTSFAYPYGYSRALVRSEVRAAGYGAACAVANEMADGRGDRYALPRLTIRRSTSLDLFERTVTGRGVTAAFLKDRAATKGWAIVRRSRFTINWALGRA